MRKRILFLLLSLFLMAMIFYLSDMPASQSKQLSNPLATTTGLSKTTVRKIAHFICFFVLSGSLFGFFSTFKSLRWPALPAYLTTVVYAVTDEVHQVFVPGRSCELRDVLIDSAGALAFLLLWSLILAILRCRKRT